MERWCALSVRKSWYGGEQSGLARQCIPSMLLHLFKKQLRVLSVVRIKDYPLHAFAILDSQLQYASFPQPNTCCWYQQTLQTLRISH